MRRVISAFLTAALLALTVCAGSSGAQPTTSVGFRNELKIPVIVQGYSVVGGSPRKGQPVILSPKRIGLDNNVPAGPRIYSIYDANQPARVLLRDCPVNVTGNDLFIIRASPVPGRAILIPD